MASAVAVAARASLASSTGVIAKRSLLKFLRTPQLLWTTTIQGVMFLVIFRYIFGGAIGTGELGYVDFVVPGIVTTMLIWQGMRRWSPRLSPPPRSVHQSLRPEPFTPLVRRHPSSFRHRPRRLIDHQPVSIP
jgi:ABC-2 type transport system permease protein